MSKPHFDPPDQSASMTSPARLKRETGHRGSLWRSVGRSWLVALLTAVLSMGVVIGTPHSANADPAPVSLGDAASFGVLAGSAVTNTNLTAITGDLGVSPGSSVSGFPPGTVSGAVHAGDATASGAKADLVAAYNDITGRTPVVTIPTELGGTTRTTGIYNSASGAFGITGTLTLDAEGEPDAVFIFKASALSAANVSNINLVNGAQEDNVFWQVSGSATLGTFSTFRGNILALTSVMVGSGATLYGRAFALNNTVTLQGTSNPPATRVSVPNDPPTTTTLTTSANPSQRGQPVTFTAVVSPVTGSLVPQGQVVFKDGPTIIGSGWHDNSDPATFTTSSLAAGQHSITAVYLGGDTHDGEAIVHFAPSRSPELIQTVRTSLWDNSAVPAIQSHLDPKASTAGVKFRATTAGTVTGVRFYKGSQNTGTHVGGLWTSSGQLLASAAFTNETASGWQQVNFPTPVSINADTTYVASYHSTSGFYSVTRPYFTTQYTNNPLLALANGAEGGNGVYKYGPTNAFPTDAYQSSNYWVDVVFTPSDTP
ncbi:ice-binding family protein [Streptosporangium canum]|uniref:ice-binding family protein n=1 Tax=Streptosporangium canum TaxID=324952 RepID=UPI0037AA9B12